MGIWLKDPWVQLSVIHTHTHIQNKFFQLLLHEHRLPLWDDNKCLEINSGNGSTRT